MKRKKDELYRIADFGENKLEEISQKFPALRKSEIKEIAALCEEKLDMKNNDFYEKESVREPVEVIRKTPWYRRPAIGIAASLALTAGLTGAVYAGFRNSASIDRRNSSSDTSLVFREDVCESTTASFSSEKNTSETTTAATTISAKDKIETPTEPITEVPLTERNTQDKPEAEVYPEETEPSVEQAFGSGEEIEITQEKAQEFLYALDLIDRFGGCGIQYDENDCIYTSSGTVYRVTEPGFNTRDDVIAYMNKYLTKSYIDERYSGFFANDDPILIDADMGGWDALYTRFVPKACGFAWSGAPAIEKQTDDMYTILAPYNDFGVTDTLAISIIRDADGIWKIDMITYGS